jgi:hypothetical protein
MSLLSLLTLNEIKLKCPHKYRKMDSLLEKNLFIVHVLLPLYDLSGVGLIPGKCFGSLARWKVV